MSFRNKLHKRDIMGQGFHRKPRLNISEARLDEIGDKLARSIDEVIALE